MSEISATELSAASGILESYINAAINSRAKWIEERLESLIRDGIEMHRIAIEEHPNSRSVITVDAVPLCEWRLSWPDENSVTEPT